MITIYIEADMCVYLKAWNARMDDRKIQVLQFREDENIPKVK